MDTVKIYSTKQLIRRRLLKIYKAKNYRDLLIKAKKYNKGGF
jgi:hypothetical protein